MLRSNSFDYSTGSCEERGSVWLQLCDTDFFLCGLPGSCYKTGVMFSLQRLLGKEDKFFDLLEASAEEARASAQALIKLAKEPGKMKSLSELIGPRRREKQINTQISEALCTIGGGHLRQKGFGVAIAIGLRASGEQGQSIRRVPTQIPRAREPDSS